MVIQNGYLIYHENKMVNTSGIDFLTETCNKSGITHQDSDRHSKKSKYPDLKYFIASSRF